MSGLRLAIGTFTIFPAGRVATVTRASARMAMLLAPLVGLLLGALAALIVWAVQWLDIPYGDLVGATLAIAVLVYLTRALHLDGLADTTDALGSGRSGDEALAIARRGDVGPFGVIAIVCVLLVDVVALASSATAGVTTAIIAVATGRLAAVWACRTSVPAARPDGLGAMVAGTVPAWGAAAWTLLLCALAYALTRHVAAPCAVLVGLVAAALLVHRCVRRLGGITGDVLGAAVEVATAATLVVFALSSATVSP